MTSARYHHYYHHVLPTMYGITASLSWPARRLPVVLPLPPSRPSIFYEIHVAFRLPASADRGISVQNYTTCYMTQAQELYNDYNYIINYQNRGESIGSFPVHPSTNQGSNLQRKEQRSAQEPLFFGHEAACQSCNLTNHVRKSEIQNGKLSNPETPKCFNFCMSDYILAFPFHINPECFQDLP